MDKIIDLSVHQKINDLMKELKFGFGSHFRVLFFVKKLIIFFEINYKFKEWFV